MKTAKLIAILVLVLLLGTLVLQNRDPVQTHFLMFTATMPHILLLLLTAGAGVCLGLLVALGVKNRPDDKLGAGGDPQADAVSQTASSAVGGK